jgi:non-haem Fe2+, alpha-ketoglutarate-dependent halogenase
MMKTGRITMIRTDQSIAMIASECDLFREQGYLGPYRLPAEVDMDAFRAHIEHVFETDAPDHGVRHHNRHLDDRPIHDLATHPAIVDRMISLYGPDLLLWRTNFFVKEPGAKAIPWHQDFNYWPLEPPVIVSAWIAIDPARTDNSCLQIIPGSHKRVIPHVPAGDEVQFNEMGDPNFIDPRTAVSLEMEPGEFVLFNERTLHYSAPNTSSRRRIGLAVRVVVPIVKVLDYDAPDHGLVVIAGHDPIGHNRIAAPPAG